jgi:hypothetical protein
MHAFTSPPAPAAGRFPIARYARSLPPQRRDSFAVFVRRAAPEELEAFLRRIG